MGVPAPSNGEPYDTVLRRLREQIAVRRRGAAVGVGGHGAATPFAGVDDPLSALLDEAARVGRIGTAVPAYSAFGPLRRLLAQVVTRVSFYVLRVITVDQRTFNQLVLQSLRALQQGLGERSAEAHALRSVLDEGRRERSAIAERLRDADRDLGEQSRRLAELASELGAQRWLLTELQDASVRQRDVGAADRSGPSSRVAVSGAGPAAGRAAPTAAPAFHALAFAEAFRGSEALIMERQRAYVADFAGCRDVLDLACGRGEFLQLLREAGVTARGVDADPDMIQRCREKGLDVIQAEALPYLATLPDASLGGIFSAQFVEHLPSGDTIELIRLAQCKLRPGGVLLVETLNPESLLVHFRWFWMDPTHVRLVHPDTLMFLLRCFGFHDATCRFVAPSDHPPMIPALRLTTEPGDGIHEFNAATDCLNRLLYGSYEYAVRGVR